MSKTNTKKKAKSAPPPLTRDGAAIKIQKVFKKFTKERQQQQQQLQPPQRVPKAKATCSGKPGWYNPRMISKRKIIGKGGFGTVYLGINNATGEQVAIKEIITDCALGCLNSFSTELNALRKLDHPNIVKLYGFAADHNIATLYLEYVPMGSLFTMLQLNQGRFHELFLRRTMMQVCQGVGYLHELDLLHRDLKPHNILMDTQGVIKVTDFGCCKQLRESTTTTQQLTGTPSYMAPEAIENKVSKGSDVWGIGATFIHLASGKVPWSELNQSSNVALIYHIGSGRGKAGHHPAIPNHLSTAGKAVLKKCFAPESADRSTCEELLKTEFLQNVQDNLPDAESLADFAKYVAETSSSEDSDMTTWISSMDSESMSHGLSYQDFRSTVMTRFMKLQEHHLEVLNRENVWSAEEMSMWESNMSNMSNMSNSMSGSSMNYMPQPQTSSSENPSQELKEEAAPRPKSKPTAVPTRVPSKESTSKRDTPAVSQKAVTKSDSIKSVPKQAKPKESSITSKKSPSPTGSSSASPVKKKKSVGGALKKLFSKKKSDS